MREDSNETDKLDRDLLRGADVPRDAATIGYLVCGNRPADFDVEARMADLGRRGFAALDPATGWWSITDAGREALRAPGWELTVEDVFEIADRGQFVVCEVRHGSAEIGDWFVVARAGRVGRLLAVELVTFREPREGTVTVRTDLVLQAGDVLTSCEPPPAAS